MEVIFCYLSVDCLRFNGKLSGNIEIVRVDMCMIFTSCGICEYIDR